MHNSIQQYNKIIYDYITLYIMIIMMYNEYNDVIIFINCNYILHNKCNMLIFKLFFKIMQDYAKIQPLLPFMLVRKLQFLV